MKHVGYFAMRRRHYPNTHQVFEMDHDQNWNNMEQPFIPSGRAASLENGSYIIPTDAIPSAEGNFAPHWNPARSSNSYSSSSVNVDLPPYQAINSGPSYDPFYQPPVPTNFCPVSENHLSSQSSSYYRNSIHESGGSSQNSVTGHGRGPCKRKSPSIPDVGSSSYSAISSNCQLDMPASGSQHCPWDPIGVASSYNGRTHLSIAENSERNVRSRPAFNVEANMARARLSADHVCSHHQAGHLMDHSSTMSQSGLNNTAATHVPNHFVYHAPWNNVLPRARVSHRDTSHLNLGMEQLVVGSGGADSSTGFSDVYRNPASYRDHFGPQQNLQYPPTQAVVGGLNNYAQRPISAYRTPQSQPHMRHAQSSVSDGLVPMPDSYFSRQSRPIPSIGWHSSDRSGRSRMSYEIPHLLSDEANAFEGYMVVSRSNSFYASRDFLDQHRDMRLDVDNMSYEELLALGERIGNVSTGLSEGSTSKCLIESIYRSDQIHDEAKCVICLEEYKNKDELGKLMKCGHGYHANCIKDWLLVKNVCPICKAPALEDKK